MTVEQRHILETKHSPTVLGSRMSINAGAHEPFRQLHMSPTLFYFSSRQMKSKGLREAAWYCLSNVSPMELRASGWLIALTQQPLAKKDELMDMHSCPLHFAEWTDLTWLSNHGGESESWRERIRQWTQVVRKYLPTTSSKMLSSLFFSVERLYLDDKSILKHMS